MKEFINKIKSSSEILNENKYFIGISMILLNIGARFIIDELGDDLREIVTDPIIRKIFIFCSFFMATRDIFTAIILTLIFVIIINEFLITEKEQSENEQQGGSFNKKELEKTIQQLKNIQSTI